MLRSRFATVGPPLCRKRDRAGPWPVYRQGMPVRGQEWPPHTDRVFITFGGPQTSIGAPFRSRPGSVARGIMRGPVGPKTASARAQGAPGSRLGSMARRIMRGPVSPGKERALRDALSRGRLAGKGENVRPPIPSPQRPPTSSADRGRAASSLTELATLRAPDRRNPIRLRADLFRIREARPALRPV